MKISIVGITGYSGLELVKILNNHKKVELVSIHEMCIRDRVLTADNHQWISYLGYDYVRYYADIATLTPAKAETPTVKPTETNQAKPETTGDRCV